MLTLIFGNRNYSTWSLRAWLHLTESGISFQEQRIALFEPGHEERMARVSPTGKVPVLLDGDITVWDSWAIIEHARLAHGASVGWPEDPAARAHALGVSAEMHAGFSSVRAELPMNLRAPVTERWGRLSESARTEVERIRASWTQCLERYKGPFLFGALSIADILYAPVVTRFRTYGIALDPRLSAYSEAVLELAGMQAWIAAAQKETETLASIDALIGEAPG